MADRKIMRLCIMLVFVCVIPCMIYMMAMVGVFQLLFGNGQGIDTGRTITKLDGKQTVSRIGIQHETTGHQRAQRKSEDEQEA